MAAPEPIVTVIRPILTPDERTARMDEIKKAVAQFYIACAKKGIELPSRKGSEEGCA